MAEILSSEAASLQYVPLLRMVTDLVYDLFRSFTADIKELRRITHLLFPVVVEVPIGVRVSKCSLTQVVLRMVEGIDQGKHLFRNPFKSFRSSSDEAVHRKVWPFNFPFPFTKLNLMGFPDIFNRRSPVAQNIYLNEYSLTEQSQMTESPLKRAGSLLLIHTCHEAFSLLLSAPLLLPR